MPHRKLLSLVLLCAFVALGLLPTSSVALRLPSAPDCPIFPKDNPWNQRVTGLPVHRRSGAILRSIGLEEGLHPDFGSGQWEGAPIGIPFTSVPGDQERVPVTFEYNDESDQGPYPIPSDAQVEGGRNSDGDRHVIIIDRAECRLYEVFAAYPMNAVRAGTPDRAPPGISGRTDCGPSTGPLPMRRVCRSSPASRATMKYAAAG